MLSISNVIKEMKTGMFASVYQKKIREKTPLMNISEVNECAFKNKVTQPPVTSLSFHIFISGKM